MKITAERLREVMGYDPETGEFRWRERQDMRQEWNTRFAEKIAGTDSLGYRQIMIDGRRYLAHRLAWLYVTGEWPPHQIDHHDLDKVNNRFVNLRLATHAQNKHNVSAQSNNTSGVKGVCWHKRERKWHARIWINGQQIHLGYFDQDKIDEAKAAYAEAARKYHGKFARVA